MGWSLTTNVERSTIPNPRTLPEHSAAPAVIIILSIRHLQQQKSEEKLQLESARALGQLPCAVAKPQLLRQKSKAQIKINNNNIFQTTKEINRRKRAPRADSQANRKTKPILTVKHIWLNLLHMGGIRIAGDPATVASAQGGR